MSGFVIDIVADQAVPPPFVKMAEEAALTWEQVIVAALPRNVEKAQLPYDIQITLRLNYTCVAHRLAQTAPTDFRRAADGSLYGLPYRAELHFCDDMWASPADPRWSRVVLHEIGHALGIGILWGKRGLLGETGNYQGEVAMARYAEIRPGPGALKGIPVERVGVGRAGVHWEESAFGSELMTPEILAVDNPLSAVSLGSLADLGYKVDMSRAEEFRFGASARLERAFRARIK